MHYYVEVYPNHDIIPAASFQRFAASTQRAAEQIERGVLFNTRSGERTTRVVATETELPLTDLPS